MRILQHAKVTRPGVTHILVAAAGLGLSLPALAADLGETALMMAPEPPGSVSREEADSEQAAPTDETEGSPAIIPSPGTRTGLWTAQVECLYAPGEPRALSPCIPGPPCDPSHPPVPYDLVGVAGVPSDGPIYRGPCEPRTGTHDDLHFWRLHRLRDRFIDWFYTPK